MRWIGVRSYGIYLWHYPVIVLTTPANTTENLPRAAVQVAATIVLAALSWRYVEEPIRRGAISRAWRRVKARRLTPIGPARLTATVGAVGVLGVACAGLAGVGGFPASTSGAANLAGGSLSAVTTPAAGAPASGRRHCAAAAQRRPAGCTTPQGSPSPSPTMLLQDQLRTSCTAVAHIGDSTSDGLVSSDYLPDPADRIQARYQDVGAQAVYTDITGARSIVETLPGTTNGDQAAQNLIRQGFHGCWVIALGTNDTADVAVGSNAGLAARIQEMMQVTQGEPVMWVNVISLLSSGPYAEANMASWNSTLMQVCASHPNMRVFNWAAVSQPSWFINDGIHYTSAGYAKRALYIADGLAMAFPQTGKSAHCLISLPDSLTSPAPSPSPSGSASASATPTPSGEPPVKPATAARP
jgi:lysophospholipase L1-like esterase